MVSIVTNFRATVTRDIFRCNSNSHELLSYFLSKLYRNIRIKRMMSITLDLLNSFVNNQVREIKFLSKIKKLVNSAAVNSQEIV